MKGMHPFMAEALALGAQLAIFFVGLVGSLVVGMALAAHLDGPGGLLLATVIAGSGLLAAAAFSQVVRDWLTQRGIED